MWKIIEGFNNLYSISDFGAIKNNIRNKDLKTAYNHKNQEGYKSVKLVYYKDNKKLYKTLYVHRLVAKYFIPNIANKPCVNHIDGNKDNNHCSNLEWVTHKENMKHSLALGLHNKIKKKKLTNEQLDEAIYLVLNKNYDTKQLMKHHNVCVNISNWINIRAKETGLYEQIKNKKLEIKSLATSNKKLRSNIRYYGITDKNIQTKEYCTLIEAAIDLNLNPGNISNSINKGTKCGKFKWYKRDYKK